MSRERRPCLAEAALRIELAALPAWTLTEGALRRTFLRANFDDALALLIAVAELARERNHHPDVTIVWNRLTLDLRSHDAGGVTARDADLAHAIDDLAERFGLNERASGTP